MQTIRTSRTGIACLLALITAASTALACVWAVRVPFFQRPDELAHADYAFTLADVGRPFVVHDARASYVPVAPEIRFLAATTGYRSMRYNPFARAPRGYASARFVAALDAAAPHASGTSPPDGAAVPYVAFAYPAGYYALAAIVVGTVHALTGSLWWSFLAARLAGAALLSIALPLAYRTFRESGVRAGTALVATAAIGFFPLVSWVSGCIQPDNLSFALVTGCVFLCARMRRHGLSMTSCAMLATCLAALLLTKQHYGVATWLAALAFVATRRPGRDRRRFAGALALVLAVPASAFALSFRATPAAHVASVASTVAGIAPHHTFDPVRLANDFVAGFGDEFAGGSGFDGYWFYDFRDARVFGRRVQPALTPMFAFATLATIVLWLAATAKIGWRTARIAWRRSPAVALRLAGSGTAANAYVLVSAAILTAYALEHGDLWLEGRYWYPVIVPLVAMLLVTLPSLRRARQRPALARGIATTLLAVSACLAPLALASMERNFYGPSERAPRIDRLAGIERVAGAGRRCVTIRGYAVDLTTGLPAERVALLVDGVETRAVATGLPEHRLATLYNDGALERAGFLARLDTAAWAPGTHTIAFAVRTPAGVRLAFPRPVYLAIGAHGARRL